MTIVVVVVMEVEVECLNMILTDRDPSIKNIVENDLIHLEEMNEKEAEVEVNEVNDTIEKEAAFLENVNERENESLDLCMEEVEVVTISPEAKQEVEDLE